MHPVHTTTQHTDTAPTFSTSLAYKSELEVDVLMPFAHCLPPSQAKASWGVGFMAFRRCSHLLHSSRMQDRVCWFLSHFDAIRASSTFLACNGKLKMDLWPSTPFAPPHARASRRWTVIAFRCHSHLLHFPFMQQQVSFFFRTILKVDVDTRDAGTTTK